MDILLSKSPIVNTVSSKSIRDYYVKLVQDADCLNIATGFISNESLVELKRMVEERENKLKLNMLIGMNYLDGFTKLQYDAVTKLNSYLCKNSIGHIYLSRGAKYHGKMYCFQKEGNCIGGFLGSSNLGSFMGTSDDLIESDVFFDNKDGDVLNQRINKIIDVLGTDFTVIPPITDFIIPTFNLLDDHTGVDKVSDEYVRGLLSKQNGHPVLIPLKTKPKSNLNTYFGAGKIKGRYSPRNWYEVEIIIGKDVEYRESIPENQSITVVTEDGYKFKCSRQGDYGKNFRSDGDLKILGKWIKGKMEIQGALKLGELVTAQTLLDFNKNSMMLIPTVENGVWILKLV